jgi:hypothetical protein
MRYGRTAGHHRIGSSPDSLKSAHRSSTTSW